MNYVFCIFALLLIDAKIDSWENRINPRDGLSYIKVAEDLHAKGIETNDQRQLIQELYVLAAVADSVYRDSAILGLLSIELDQNMIQKLQLLRSPTRQLVPSVINSSLAGRVESEHSKDEICSALVAIRQGSSIDEAQLSHLRPWAFMFPSSFDPLFRGEQLPRKQLNDNELVSTLRVELTVLGGATLWSADAVSTGVTPVVISMSNDIATLMKVNPTLRLRSNGRWVSE
jgi:hypothetical protein